MDEIWERAVETALGGQTEPGSTRVLTLDGAVKCVQGHLPRPEILERFKNLEHLSIASVGVSSLDQFPRLGKLQKLVLSDNRISGGLEFLVEAGLVMLRDLDLSNNRIQLIEDLLPLAQLKLVSLDLYKCPVTRTKDYRSRVFGLVKSLKYLDKMDAEENERPESEDEEDEDDPGSDEIGGEERPNGMSNGHSERLEGVVEEVDEEDSEADEEEAETGRETDGVSGHANGIRDEHLNMDEEENDESDEEDGEDEYEADGLLLDDTREIEEEDLGESEEEVGNDEGQLGVPPRDFLQRDMNGEFDGHEEVEEAGRQSHFVANGAQNVLVNGDEEENDDSDEEDEEDEYEPDGLLVDDTRDIEEEDVGESEEEEVDNDEVEVGVPHRNDLLRDILVGEIDGHEQDEDDGESWEEQEQGVEDGEDEEEEYGGGRLAQPVAEAIQVDEEEEYEDDEGQVVYSIASPVLKRKRDEDDDGDSVSNSSDYNDDDGSSEDVSSDDDE